jgi:hypothetical protein
MAEVQALVEGRRAAEQHEIRERVRRLRERLG